MNLYNDKVNLTGMMALAAVIINAIVLRNGLVVNPIWYWGLSFTIPFLFIAFLDHARNRKKTDINDMT